MCPINSMLLEILELVFEFVRGEKNDKSLYWQPQHVSLGRRLFSWIAFTHVCQSWRECALGMKRLWRFVHITEANHQRVSAATTFLERSKPLRVTFYHETYWMPSPATQQLLNSFYITLVENRDRIAGFFLCGIIHQTAWMLVEEGLPNAVEIGLHPFSPPRMYGNSLQNQTIFKTQLDGPALTVKKLSLFDCSCSLKSYPNITHLYLHYQKCFPHDDDSTLRFISSLSDTLQVLTLRNAGVTSSIFTQAKSGKRIRLPNLRQIEVMLESFDEHGRDRSLDILRYLSLPASVSILWSPCSDGSESHYMVHFPSTKRCNLVQNIVVSLEQLDHCLIEGDTAFVSADNIDDSPKLHELCTRFVNVTSMSLPSLWIMSYPTFRAGSRYTRSMLPQLVNELYEYQGRANNRHPLFCGALTELHVYTGESDRVILEEKMRRKISRGLVKRGLAPLELSADHSMQFYRDKLSKGFTLYFHPGELPTRHVEQYW